MMVALIIIGATSCTSKQSILLVNPLNVDRFDETILVGRNSIEAKFGRVPDGYAPAVLLNGEYVSSQADDLNGDGKWDELVFTLDFKASESIKVVLEYLPEADYPKFKSRTNLQLGIAQPDGTFKEVDKYEAPSIMDGFKIVAQGEGVSWENDKMGFRIYFDCRNIKDLFGKLTADNILDKLHTPVLPDYHVLSEWGMDVLHCGSSLGAGGLAMLESDSLYRLGSTDGYLFDKIVEGPVRSVFDLKYTGWDVAGQSLSAVERISIYPGKYWFQSDVTVSGFTGEKQLATGIVTSKLKNEPIEFDANSDYFSIATLDVQSENSDELGMAVLLKKDEVTKVDRTTDINFYELGFKTVDEKGFSNVISETYYVAQKIYSDISYRHFFFAVWGLENEMWKNPDNFKGYISSEADLLNNPIIVE